MSEVQTLPNQQTVQPVVKTDQPKPEGQDTPVSPQPQAEDLLSRVTKFVENEGSKLKSEDNIDKEIYNDAEFRAKIDAIQDPQLKEYMIKLRKSGVRGVNEKLGEIAEIRKEIQSLKESNTPKGWTKERVQQLTNDPEFIKAAQEVANASTQPEDEYVPDSVKKKLAELDAMKQQLNSFQQTQFLKSLESEHQQLSTKYGNYDRNRIDEIRKELLEGKIVANSEHLYKAFYHDDNVRKAYELGRNDERSGVSEKQRVSSISVNSTQVPSTDIKIDKSETDRDVWNKIVNKALSSIQKK